MIDTARRILKEGPICDSCLGRQFAKLSTGLSNSQRGNSIKLVLSMQATANNDTELQTDLAPTLPQARKLTGGDQQAADEECWFCRGLFQDGSNLKSWAEKCISSIEGHEFDTLLVGTKVPPIFAEKEEVLWAECGIAHAEPVKSELNREVGKLISMMTGKTVDFKRPDVVFTIDLAEEKVEVQVNSLFIYGRYNKHSREIPQTRWPCKECQGKGCDRCDNTGKMYSSSVEEEINRKVIETFKADDAILHGAGREDIDALMLGTGRPFVMEVMHPRVRSVDLKQLRDSVNSSSDKVKVSELAYVQKSAVEEVKAMKVNKQYRLKVIYNEDISIETLKSSIVTLSNSEIFQRTPERVSHRRADLERKRKVYEIDLEKVNEDEKYFLMTVRCEGGLYVKELVSGDNGRTKPSLTELVGKQLKVQELDVINVEGGISWQDHMVKEKRQDTSLQRH
ncbi:tRNA pseudouridine(54/55) synthase Pus10 [Methanocella sp. CWC-04]|uniref:tRNA pseudouridine synthase Pus10 n=1 Tax=Methanooceanicella nereidis TaxID=2052831 RepID=A0AAP2W501_9EURY|nr:tRNA pseudouridine(54/55) synthase Pus10 [Methanocella sp. CWC-04]